MPAYRRPLVCVGPPRAAARLLRTWAFAFVAAIAVVATPHIVSSTMGVHLIGDYFVPNAAICREGETADRMWVLTRGTVSIRMATERGTYRIASLAAGTTVGEMALLETGPRSATVTADEEVSSYELGRDAFDVILRDHPRIAQKLLSYFAREMARRLRLSDRELRAVSG